MSRPVRHGHHDHMVAVAPADLDGFLHLPAQVLHLVRRDVEEVEGLGIGEAVMIKPRPEPDRPVVATLQKPLLDQILDDHIDGRKRRSDSLGDGIGADRLHFRLQEIQDLQGTIDAADARATAALLGRSLLDIGKLGVHWIFSRMLQAFAACRHDWLLPVTCFLNNGINAIPAT